MAGRPRIPIEVKRARGDVAKVGRLLHEEMLAGALDAKRGMPPEPADFAPDPKPQTEDEEAIAAWVIRERVRARARVHWSYLMRTLGENSLLRECDQGILAGMAWNFANMAEAALACDFKALAQLQAAYNSATNLTGLNESARAKMPKPAASQMSEIDMALADGLPDEAEPLPFN